MNNQESELNSSDSNSPPDSSNPVSGIRNPESNASLNNPVSGIRYPKWNSFQEFLFAFAVILSLFYVNPEFVRYIFGIYFIFFAVHSIIKKQFFPKNPILRGIWVFSAGILISVAFSPYRKEGLFELKYLFTALGAIAMYWDIAPHRLQEGRPPLVWPEIGGIWVTGVLVMGYFLGWSEEVAPKYHPFFRATSITCGYIGLVITAFILVNILVKLYQKKKFTPSKGYWIFLGIFAPILASRISYYLLQKELIQARLWPTVWITLLLWAVSFLWLISGKTRVLVQILCIIAGGYLTYLSWSRSAFFPYFVLLIIGGNLAILMKWSKVRLLCAAGYTLAILAVFFIALHMFMFWDRTRGSYKETDTKVEQVIHLTKREDVYETSWELFKKYPVTGVGFNKHPFQELFPGFHPDKRVVAHAHNLFVHVLATQGIIGFACLMFLCFTLISQLIKHLSSGREINAVFFLPICMMCVLGLMHYPFVSYRFLNAFFTLGIAALVLTRKD